MAISAEQLNIILSAQDKALTKALDRSTKNVNRFAKKSQQNLSRTSKSFDSLGKAARRLAPIIAAAVSVGAARNAITLGKEIADLSRIAGTTAEEFQELAFAAKTVGIDQNKLSDIIKDMNDRVGDFLATGGGPMKDFFEQVAPLVGVTADQFRDLSGPQALQLYASTLEKAGANQQDFTFFMEAMASDATALVPLLRNNASGFKEIGKQARDAGAIMSNETVAGAAALDAKLDTLGTTIQTSFTNMLINNQDELENLTNFIINTGIPAIEKLLGVLSSAASGAAVIGDVLGQLRGDTDIRTVTAGQTGSIIRESLEARLSKAQSEKQQLMDRMTEQNLNDMRKDLNPLHNANLAIQKRKLLSLATEIDNIKTQISGLGGTDTGLKLNMTEGTPMIKTSPSDLPDKGGFGTGIDFVDTETTNSTRDQVKAYEDLVRSLNPAVDATIKYAEQLHIINAELDSGRISQDQSNALIDQARQEMQKARREASKFASVFETVESSIESSMMGLVNGTMNVKDAFKSMAAQVVSDLYRVLVVQQMVNAATSAMGGGTGGFLSSMLMGTRAGGGSVQAGNPYMTGESGRELFVPAQNGRILSPAQTRMAGGGEAVTVVQNINISTGVQQTVRAEIKGMMPQIADNAKAAVLDAKRRGGSFGRAMA
jgi:hypothetical protein